MSKEAAAQTVGCNLSISNLYVSLLHSAALPQELYGWLKEYSPRSDRLFGLVCDYLETGADWWRLCGRLLPLLPPADLLSFATGLLEGAPLPAWGAAAGDAQPAPPAGAWLVFGGGQRWGSLGQLLVAAAAGCSLRQLGRLVREEENTEELQVSYGENPLVSHQDKGPQ